jgi:hypothetical protein
MDLVAVRLGWPAGAGPSAFHAAPFSAPARRVLGQTEQQWYPRAKAAVAKWGELSARAERIADAAYRDEIQARYRAPGRRDAVAADVAAVEARAPADYSVFASASARARVETLEALNRDFEAHVAFGERRAADVPSLDPLLVGVLAAAGVAVLLFFLLD